MTEELTVVGTFWQATEAHIAKSVLEEAGIQAFLENENSVTVTPHLAAPSGIKLLVKRSDARRASETLKT